MRHPTIQTWSGRLPVLLLALCPAAMAQAASSAAFAAPTTFSAPSAGFGVLRLVLALALVLAAVYAAAALLRRLRMGSAPDSAQLQLVTQVALGTRERAVLLRAGSQLLLVGVAPGNVRLLSVLPEPAAPPPSAGATGAATPSLPSFRELLRKSLGR
jgi:flagellar protein FliO/FliZ